jgi:hypothetical protein
VRGYDYAKERHQQARQASKLGSFVVEQIHQRVSLSSPPRVQSVGKPLAGRKFCGKKHATQREAPVLRDCLAWLHKQGIFAHRENTGTAWINGQPVSFGYPGAADITGILPDGRRLEIETKSAKGKQSDKQKAYQQRIEENHGVYLLVRSVKELEEKWQQL